MSFSKGDSVGCAAGLVGRGAGEVLALPAADFAVLALLTKTFALAAATGLVVPADLTAVLVFAAFLGAAAFTGFAAFVGFASLAGSTIFLAATLDLIALTGFFTAAVLAGLADFLAAATLGLDAGLDFTALLRASFFLAGAFRGFVLLCRPILHQYAGHIPWE